MIARNTKKILFFLVVFCSFGVNSRTKNETPIETSKLNLLEVDSIYNKAVRNFDTYVSNLYSKLNDSTLSFKAFEHGVTGYLNMVKQQEVEVDRYLTIIDFSMPSNSERLFIFDVCKQELVYKSIVAHGQNSGGLYPTKFSNKDNSHQSSLGFYVTTSTYRSSKYDLALRLDGKEYTNSKARSRGVVMHGAKYATYEFLDKHGILGRSYGCPAMPYKNFDKVVSMIKNGSCLYIYYPNSYYQRHSKYLTKKNYLVDFI